MLLSFSKTAQLSVQILQPLTVLTILQLLSAPLQPHIQQKAALTINSLYGQQAQMLPFKDQIALTQTAQTMQFYSMELIPNGTGLLNSELMLLIQFLFLPQNGQLWQQTATVFQVISLSIVPALHVSTPALNMIQKQTLIPLRLKIIILIGQIQLIRLQLAARKTKI